MSRELEELMTLKEVAGYLRISERTAQRFVASGQLRIIRIGKKPLVTREQLNAFVAYKRERR